MTKRGRFLAGETFNIYQEPGMYKFCAGTGDFSFDAIMKNSAAMTEEFYFFCRVTNITEKSFIVEMSLFGQVQYGKVNFDQLMFYDKAVTS